MNGISLMIRKVEPEEAADFAQFCSGLFAETFAEFINPKDLELYLEKSFNLEKIEKELSDPDTSVFYAVKNSIPIGCIKLIFDLEDASFTGKKPVEISRLYVNKTYHNQKIGASLMQFAISFTLENKAEKLKLGVWEFNKKAIDFYLKWGFVKTGTVQFRIGNDLQQDWLMEKTLS